MQGGGPDNIEVLACRAGEDQGWVRPRREDAGRGKKDLTLWAGRNIMPRNKTPAGSNSSGGRVNAAVR